MTRNEFSDMFDTMLNSYNTQANFGEEASKADITLDEYEKSVLLTQAQDIIVKSYFDRTLNAQGQGFDDSTRRQVDFSSLIKVADLSPISGASSKFDNRGILFQMPMKEVTVAASTYTAESAAEENARHLVKDTNDKNPGDDGYVTTYEDGYTPVSNGSTRPAYSETVENTTDVLFILNEKMIYNGKDYVIVPLNYKEYDREMSKPFAQPLKKQAWRLFQNNTTKFDVLTELIPKETLNITNPTYRIRYVRRPVPIVLEDMPDDLSIDGVSTASDCELNPILHIDILNKAVELAISTRGGAAAQRGVPPANGMRQTNN